METVGKKRTRDLFNDGDDVAVYEYGSSDDPNFSFFSPVQGHYPESSSAQRENGTHLLHHVQERHIENVSLLLKKTDDSDIDACIEVQDNPLVVFNTPGATDEMYSSYQYANMVKSDMLTTLKKQKIHVDYLSRVLAASKGRLTETESEKQVLSNIAEKLEASLAMSNGKASAYQNQLIETTSKREELLLKSLAQITELQDEVSQETKLRRELQERLFSTEQDLKAAELKLENCNCQPVGGIWHNPEKLLSEIESLREVNASLELELESTKEEFQKAQVTIRNWIDEAQNYENLVIERDEKIDKLEMELMEAQEANVQLKTAGTELETETVEMLRKENERQAAELSALKLLSQQHQVFPLAEEDLKKEQHRIEQLEGQLADMQKSVHEANLLKQEMEMWHATIAGIPGVDSRVDLFRVYGELQSQLRTAAANRDELQKEKETLTAKLAEAETARCMAEADATSEKERANKLLTDLSKAELKLALTMQERDNLSSLLATYEDGDGDTRTAKGSSL